MVLHENDAQLAVSYSSISQVYYALNNQDKPNQYINKSLKRHHKLITSCNILASIYHKRNKFKKALRMYKRALQIQIECLPYNHPDIAKTYNNISQIHSILNR